MRIFALETKLLSIVAATALLTVAGCAEQSVIGTKVWAKPGAAKAEIAKDMTACQSSTAVSTTVGSRRIRERAAYDELPSPVMSLEAQRKRRGASRYVLERRRTARMLDKCMLSKGYQPGPGESTKK